MMKPLKQFLPVAIASTLTLGIGALATNSLSAKAQEFSARTSFGVPFQLSAARTTQSSVRFRGASYYFTFDIPKTSTKALHKVIIQQQNGALIQMDRQRINAYLGKDRDQEIKLSDIKIDNGAQEVSVTFNPPIQPGQTVTVGLGPFENPSIGGVYQFMVKAYPFGPQPQGEFVGYGPIRFFDAR
jgi:hypothetical protein